MGHLLPVWLGNDAMPTMKNSSKDYLRWLGGWLGINYRDAASINFHSKKGMQISIVSVCYYTVLMTIGMHQQILVKLPIFTFCENLSSGSWVVTWRQAGTGMFWLRSVVNTPKKGQLFNYKMQNKGVRKHAQKAGIQIIHKLLIGQHRGPQMKLLSFILLFNSSLLPV